MDGADDGIRTRDPNLGKVVLYQLSHVRVRQMRLSAATAPSPPQEPLCPKPPSPRSVSARLSVTTKAALATAITTSWAMRSPRRTV